MSRYSSFNKYEHYLDLSIPSVNNRLKYKSAQAYQKAIIKSRKYIYNLKNMDKHDARLNLNSWRSYVNRSKYNFGLGLELIWKIFLTLLPLILVTVVMNYDSDFNFDFFAFCSKFANLQLNSTNNLINFYNRNKEFFSNAITQMQQQNDIYKFGINGINLIDFDWLVTPLSNFALVLNNITLVTGMLFTFLIDLFSNVIALFTALISSI